MFVNGMYSVKSLKHIFFGPGKPWNLVLAGPGKSWKLVVPCQYEPCAFLMSQLHAISVISFWLVFCMIHLSAACGDRDYGPPTCNDDMLLCLLFRFIAAYNDLKTRSPELDDEQLFTSTTDILRSSGFILQPVSDIQKVCMCALMSVCVVDETSQCWV